LNILIENKLLCFTAQKLTLTRVYIELGAKT